MSLEESLVEHCAPTLAGLKAASLYCFFPKNNRQFVLEAKLWKEWFAYRGLRLTVLRKNCEQNSYLLYLYRAEALRIELEQPKVLKFLRSLGYDTSTGYEGLLRQLRARLRRRNEFPP